MTSLEAPKASADDAFRRLMRRQHTMLARWLICALLFSASCGGGEDGETTTPPLPQRSITGITSGLTAGAIRLKLQRSTFDGTAWHHVGLEDLEVKQNGGFAFSSTLPEGAQFTVTITAQPVGQTCYIDPINDGGHLVLLSSVANTDPGAQFSVSCSPGYALAGIYETPGPMWYDLVLQDGDGHKAQYSPEGFRPTIFFPHTLQHGEAYAVSIAKDPFFGKCTLTGATGIAGIDDATGLRVNCEWGRRIFVEVSGLAGTGLALQDNFGHTLPVTHNATEGRVWFPLLLLPEGTPYEVTIMSQPTNPSQNCTVTNATGGLITETIVKVFCAAG